MKIGPQSFWLRLLVRLLLSAPFFAASLILWFMAANAGDFFSVLSRGVMAAGAMTMGAAILAQPIAEMFGDWFGALFWPGERVEASPVYSIPEARRKRGLYKEAMEEYEKIAAQFPGELRPYTAMIDLAVSQFNDCPRALSIYQRGLEALTRDEDRAALTRFYTSVLEDHARPEKH